MIFDLKFTRLISGCVFKKSNCLLQRRSQEGLVTLRKNLNRSESTAQNFFGGGQDPPAYATGLL